MIKDSAKNLFDVIVAWKFGRFACNRYDSAHYKSILRKNGVKVVSAIEPISQDSAGILLESLLEGYAEFFSAELAENAYKCKFNGGSIPFGFVIDDDQHYQAFLRQMRRLHGGRERHEQDDAWKSHFESKGRLSRDS